ncbi:redoxin domain-containing protein [Chryseobacterium echinoideorum]|uniref:redoxin domain-containing protein n=1 Tax=Chryseobacterium echinoideorum TaxID=1549648 RepID=UPI001184A3AE|nr:redoxin domain-containing protein [Chryseobacterium echinoideorum]
MKLFTILLFCCFITITSCKNKCENTEQEIKNMMKNWYRKKIIFPKDMEMLTNSPIINNNTSDFSHLKGYTIVHFFTADCDKCINELKAIKKSIQNLPEKSKINYIFIASAPTKIYVSEAIKKVNFPYPIYYEKEYYSFKTTNQLPVSNDLYNTMLLNDNQEVILFGAFYDNDKAKSFFSKIIECNL